MGKLSQVIDITSLNGIESLFRRGPRDPWGRQLAGRLADFFVYSDVAHFTMPVVERTAPIDDSALPSILTQLQARDAGFLTPLRYEAEEKRTLNPEFLDEAFQYFAGWSQNSGHMLRRWIQLHNEPWIREGHLARVRPRHVFDVEHLQGSPSLNAVATSLGVPADDILYAFDVVLRYPLYGEIAGPDAYFLAHPIREVQILPTMAVETRPLPSIALSLSEAVAEMVTAMTLDEYTSFLHEARGVIRDRKIHKLKAGALDRETTREIASLLGLPARVRAAGKIMGVAAGLISIAAGLSSTLGPSLGPRASIVGGLVSVASALWTGKVGRGPARLSWLRWALEWDIERKASDA